MESVTDVRVDSSFDAFVAARSGALLRTAYLLAGDRQHAEDLLQTALLRALRRWSRVRDAPDAYVRKVLVNLSRDWIRNRRRRPREVPAPPDPESLGGHERDVDGVMDHQVVVHQVVVQALAQLPRQQRAVVVLRYFEDLSVDQTAELLGCSAGTVKSHTSRALSRLRDLLTEDLTEDDTAPLTEVPHAH